jgi:hypothetical protein
VGMRTVRISAHPGLCPLPGIEVCSCHFAQNLDSSIHASNAKPLRECQRRAASLFGRGHR